MEESVSQPIYERHVPRPVSWASLGLVSILSLAVILSGISSLTQNISQLITQNDEMYATVMMATQQNKNQDSKLAVLNNEAKETDKIIVKYKEKDLPPGLSIATERANLEKANGLKELLTIDGIGAVVYQVGENDTAAEVVGRLMAQKKELIEYAEIDMLVPPTLIPNDPNLGSAWHVAKVSAPSAWDSAQGEGAVVAIADTGVDCTHSDLATSCVSGWNTASNNSDTTDINGHGTMVAGTAAEIGDNSVGSAGIAYKSKIMPLRVTDSTDGWANFSAIASAFTWAADHGAKVAQASYGACGSASVLSAGEYLRSKGGVATVSAGNSGANDGFSPSNNLVCVSATDSNDNRTSWSSFGDYVDVSAPGLGIYTTARGGGYASVSGTSFSGPLTAGIYALMFSANPALTPTQADNILFSSTDDIGTAGWDQYYGYGRVNAAKAVAAAIATIGTRDAVAPTAPTNLRSTNLTSNSVALAWNAATDDNSGVAGYTIYRNGTKLTTVAGTSYTNTGLTANTSYTYTVRAEDAAGNISGDSNQLAVTAPDISFGISSYSVPTKTTNSATVAVSLTKPGTVIVKYGTSNTNLNLSAQSATTSTSHSVPLASLTAATIYYYQVIATDGTATITSLVSSFKTSKATGKPVR